jgi:hypothetical protein
MEPCDVALLALVSVFGAWVFAAAIGGKLDRIAEAVEKLNKTLGGGA